jgi:hypothetical protein
VFENQDVPNEENVKIIAIKLKNHASIWREQLKMKLACKGKQKKNQNLGENGERVGKEVSTRKVFARGISSTAQLCSS